MKKWIGFTQFVALSQKVRAAEGFGTGFNYWVKAEFEFSLDFDPEQAKVDLQQVLLVLDHRALGLDKTLPVEATSSELAWWILSELQRLRPGTDVKVHLRRGDGAIFTCRKSQVGGN
ncbi:unnamed protein product [Sphagnum balticum]